MFYGDEFLIKERVSTFIDSLLDPASKTTNLQSFDGSSLNVGNLISHLLNKSLFGGIRVALVEHTTLFVSQSSVSKIVEKVVEAWKRGDSKTAYRNLKQLAGLSGVTLEAGVSSDGWLKEVDAISSLDSQDQEVLQQAATSFAQEFSGIISSGDENVILEFVQEGTPEDTYLIMTALSVDKRNRLFKAFDKNGHVEELKPRFDKSSVRLDKSYFQRSIRDFLNSRGKTITSDAIDLAFIKSGKDIRRIRSEFEKIVSYLGNRSEINTTDIKDLFLDFHEAAFFDLSRAVRESDSRKLLIALHENLKIVDHPLQTLAALASEFRKIIAARELLFTDFRSLWKPEINFDQFVSMVARFRSESPPKKIQKGKFNLLTQKDFPLFQLLKTAQNFSLQRLIHIMEAILDADIKIKSTKLGSASPNIILENLVLEICDSKKTV